MTMRIVVLKPEDGLAEGEEYFIDRMKALRMIEEGKATTPNLYDKIVKKKAEDTAKAKREEAKKKAEEAAAENKEKEENAVSKKPASRRKAVKR